MIKVLMLSNIAQSIMHITLMIYINKELEHTKSKCIPGNVIIDEDELCTYLGQVKYVFAVFMTINEEIRNICFMLINLNIVFEIFTLLMIV